MELFYVDGDRKVGPIGKNQFQSLIKTKKINAKTLVWQQGMANWTPANQVPELASMFGAEPPPLPPQP